jgi:hypothetical protein
MTNYGDDMRTSRNLEPQKLIKTSEKLTQWVVAVFPTSHLSKVAQEVCLVTQEAAVRAEAIRRPNIFLRAGMITLLAIALAGIVHQVVTRPFSEILSLLDITKGVAIYLFAALAFFITLEFRLKRRKALKAVHELRTMAHIIDMHQLMKDEVIEKFRDDPTDSPERINQYLHACTALLALVSKIGQLYVEHFPDPEAVRAVDDFGLMATGLSNKIWNKILSRKGEPAIPVKKAADDSRKMPGAVGTPAEVS